jgi:ABC-type Fe3+ transport system substrate-binding protein
MSHGSRWCSCLDRRKFLKTAGTVSAVSLAGCTGGNNENQSGQTPTSGGSNGLSTTKKKAKNEGKVVPVGAFSESGPFWQNFEDKYGIKAAYQFRDSGKTATKLIQEAKAGKTTIDVTGSSMTGSPIAYLKLAKQDVIGSMPQWIIESEETSVEPVLNRSYGKTAIAKALTVLYNENIVKNPPTTLDELFSPKWKGKITVDIRDSEFVLAAREKFGSKQRARQFLKNLGDHATWRSSHYDAAKQIARGEVPLGVTYIKYTNYDWGSPLKEARIEKFPRTGGMTILGMTQGAPHPAAAKLALYYCFKDSNMAKYFKEKLGENVYFTLDEAKKSELNLFIFSPSEAEDIDVKKIQQTWEKLTGFRR